MVNVTNKINVTNEAAFDISEILGLVGLNQTQLKAEVEYYITEVASNEQLHSDYFCWDYIDEDTGEWIVAFASMGNQIGTIQNWNINGVCRHEDIANGICKKAVKRWVKVKIVLDDKSIISEQSDEGLYIAA